MCVPEHMVLEEGLGCGKKYVLGRAGPVRPCRGRRGCDQSQPNALGHKIEGVGSAVMEVRRWRATATAVMGKTYYYSRLTKEVSQRG